MLDKLNKCTTERKNTQPHRHSCAHMHTLDFFSSQPCFSLKRRVLVPHVELTYLVSHLYTHNPSAALSHLLQSPQPRPVPTGEPSPPPSLSFPSIFCSANEQNQSNDWCQVWECLVISPLSKVQRTGKPGFKEKSELKCQHYLCLKAFMKGSRGLQIKKAIFLFIKSIFPWASNSIMNYSLLNATLYHLA